MKPELTIELRGHSLFHWSPLRESYSRPEGYTWRDWFTVHISINSMPYWWYVEIGPFFLGQEKYRER